MPPRRIPLKTPQVIDAIHADHLALNIGWIEAQGPTPTHPVTGKPITIMWHKATVDPGGTVFGPGPYLKVPIRGFWGTHEITVHRVYAPVKLRQKLAKVWVRPKVMPPIDKDTRDYD